MIRIVLIAILATYILSTHTAQADVQCTTDSNCEAQFGPDDSSDDDSQSSALLFDRT